MRGSPVARNEGSSILIWKPDDILCRMLYMNASVCLVVYGYGATWRVNRELLRRYFQKRKKNSHQTSTCHSQQREVQFWCDFRRLILQSIHCLTIIENSPPFSSIGSPRAWMWHTSFGSFWPTFWFWPRTPPWGQLSPKFFGTCSNRYDVDLAGRWFQSRRLPDDKKIKKYMKSGIRSA